MVSAKRIYTDFKVFSGGYLRNKFGLFFGLDFPVVLILIFGAIFSGGSRNNKRLCPKPRYRRSYGQNIGNRFLKH